MARSDASTSSLPPGGSLPLPPGGSLRDLRPELLAALVGLGLGLGALLITPPHDAAPPPPLVLGWEPARRAAKTRVGAPLRFSVAAEGQEVRYTWTVDGKVAGDGPRLTYSPSVEQVGRRTIELAARSPGGTIQRSWEVWVRPPRPPSRGNPPPPVVAASPPPPPPRAERASPPRTPPRAKPLPTRVARLPNRDRDRLDDTDGSLPADEGTSTRNAALAAVPPASAPPEPRAPGAAEVRGLLERYASAWRSRDVETLQAVGEVTSRGQADALRRYFAGVRELDVGVTVLSIDEKGTRTTVRFVRHDRFLDPLGRPITKQIPAIERDVVRTPQGLRFVAPGG